MSGWTAGGIRPAAGPRPAQAQQPPVQQPNAPLQKQTYKFESTTQLVIVNVSVKDKDGKPIEGLKATDFTVTEDGKPQVHQGVRIPAAGRAVLPAFEAPARPR